MNAHDWSSFLLRVPIHSDPQTIYTAWSTQKGLENWFLRTARFFTKEGADRPADVPIEVNDRYEWKWHGWPDEVEEKGMILEANGSNRLRFSFGMAGKVTISIAPEAGVCVVELVQEEIPTDEQGQVYYHIGCTKGWLFYLTNLKSILEGGIDLRNRDVQLKNVITS